MSISCRPHVDVHKGRGSGSCGHMWTGGKNPISFVDVINEWPLSGAVSRLRKMELQIIRLRMDNGCSDVGGKIKPSMGRMRWRSRFTNMHKAGANEVRGRLFRERETRIHSICKTNIANRGVSLP